MKNFNLEKFIVDISKIGGSSLNFIIREALSYQNLEIKDDKVVGIPQFKVGDWIVYKDGKTFANDERTALIKSVEDDKYRFSHGTWLGKTVVENACRKWTIKDAKPGDFVACHFSKSSTFIAIFKIHDGCDDTFASYCFKNINGEFITGLTRHSIMNNILPATREERRELLDLIEKEGYIWDFSNLELYKKILVSN